jgi:hypothetical protein
MIGAVELSIQERLRQHVLRGRYPGTASRSPGSF